MAEWRSEGSTPEQYEETVHPENPPNVVLQPRVRRAALWIYLGPLIVIAVIIAIAFLYWANRNRRPDDPVEPTTGVEEEATPGGGKPDPRYTTPEGEREFRDDKP